jgi:hypothetical protein
VYILALLELWSFFICLLQRSKVLKFKTCSPMFPAAWVVHQRVLCFSLRLWIAHIIVMLQTCNVMKKLCSLVGSIYIHVAFSLHPDKILPDMLHSCRKIMLKVLKVISSPSQEICFEDPSRWLCVILQAAGWTHLWLIHAWFVTEETCIFAHNTIHTSDVNSYPYISCSLSKVLVLNRFFCNIKGSAYTQWIRKGTTAVSHCYLAGAKNLTQILDETLVIPKCERVHDSCMPQYAQYCIT